MFTKLYSWGGRRRNAKSEKTKITGTKNKKNIKKDQDFKYITENVSKGKKNTLQQVHILDLIGNIENVYIKQEEIEGVVSDYNRNHYRKVLYTNIYNDKIYEKLLDDNIRD